MVNAYRISQGILSAKDNMSWNLNTEEIFFVIQIVFLSGFN